MKKFLLTIVSICFLLSPAFAFAAEAPPQPPNFDFNNPLEPKNSTNLTVAEVTGRIVLTLLSFVGVLAAITFIRSGLYIAFARGNDEYVKKGRQGLIWGVVGLFVVFAGWVFISFIIDRVQRVNFQQRSLDSAVGTEGLPEGFGSVPDGGLPE